MIVSFKSKKLSKLCNSGKEAQKKWGAERARVIIRRLQQLQAAPTLAEMSAVTQAYCHPLTQDRDGQFAVDAIYPKRLVFEPDHDPVPLTDDGGIDTTRVTRIIIIEVVDYHGK